jgi:hypothetical protein
MKVRFEESLGKAEATNTSRDEGEKNDDIMQRFEIENKWGVQIKGS